MEVTPEIFAWLVSLRIIDANKSLKMKNKNMLISDEIVERLLDGVYFDRILINLEDQYNKFYRLKLTYTENISKLVKGEDRLGNIQRIENWKIIGDVVMNFGIDFSEDTARIIVNGNRMVLLEVIKSLYTLSSELMKRSMNTMEISNPSVSIQKKAHGHGHHSNQEIIDMNNIDPMKDYMKCESALEFFIVSLSRNLEMKPRQSIALLANNRKYLIHIANRGIKSDYSKLIAWYEDLKVNLKILTNLIRQSKNTTTMSYATISVGLYSKNHHLAYLAYYLTVQFHHQIGFVHEWFKKQGVDSFMFSIIKHPDLRINLMNLVYEMGKKDVDKVISYFKAKDKEELFPLFGVLVLFIKEVNPILFMKFKEVMIEYCLSEIDDRSYSLSLLADIWINLHPIDEFASSAILKYYRKSIREDSRSNVKQTGIIILFRLMSALGLIKDDNAPTIYKTLVFLFLEKYDNPILKENFLAQFQNIFNQDNTIPLDIMLEPYFRQLKTSTNYDLNDLKFLAAVIKHPRVSDDNIRDILFFATIASQNFKYSRLANNIVNEIFDKTQFNNDENIYEHLIKYINETLSLFLDKPGDIFILETPYDIINMNILYINERLEKTVIDTTQIYRTQNKQHSMGLLAMLWFYEDHDDILLNCEEEHRVIYPPVNIRETKLICNKISYMRQTPEFIINKIKEEQIKSQISAKQEQENLEKREAKVRKSMLIMLEERSLVLGSSNITKLNTTKDNLSLIKEEGSIEHKQEKPVNKIIKKCCLPISLDEEENRENIAINGLIKQYDKELKYYFQSYMTESNNSIAKAHLLKMLRELGFDNDKLTLDEFNTAIRSVFNNPMNYFDTEQFNTFIIQLSYLLYTRINPALTISMCFKRLLGLLKIPKKKNMKVLTVLEETINKNPGFPLPPGYKIKTSQVVSYDYSLPESFLGFLKESQIVALEVLNEIISKSLNSNIIEPLVTMKTNSKVEVDTKNMLSFKWDERIINTYSDLDKIAKEKDKPQIEILKEFLSEIEESKTTRLERQETIKHIAPKEKIDEEEKLKFINEQLEKDKKRKLRRQVVEEQLKKMKEQQEEEARKKNEESRKIKQETEDRLKQQLLRERKLREQIKKELEENKKKKEVDIKAREEEDKQKENQKKQVKEAEKKDFFNKQKRKLRKQFRVIKSAKENLMKLQQEEGKVKIPIIDAKKILNRDKTLLEFEKNLNQTMENLLERQDIKDYITEYENHLKVIYDIYSKIGNKRISFYSEQAIHYNEFKEFCVNFTISNLLINSEQVSYIFKKVGKKNEGHYEEQFFLKYKDFLIAMAYISVMSKFTNKSRKIIPSDLTQVNMYTFKLIFDFIGLKQPFSKKEVEDMINDRRALSAKQFFRLQTQLKKEKVKEFKKANTHENKHHEDSKVNESRYSYNNPANITMDKLQPAKDLKVISPSGEEEKWKVTKSLVKNDSGKLK
jgi:hypothetical protein